MVVERTHVPWGRCRSLLRDASVGVSAKKTKLQFCRLDAIVRVKSPLAVEYCSCGVARCRYSIPRCVVRESHSCLHPSTSGRASTLCRVADALLQRRRIAAATSAEQTNAVAQRRRTSAPATATRAHSNDAAPPRHPSNGARPGRAAGPATRHGPASYKNSRPREYEPRKGPPRPAQGLLF